MNLTGGLIKEYISKVEGLPYDTPISYYYLDDKTTISYNYDGEDGIINLGRIKVNEIKKYFFTKTLNII